jgi:hypothetical protein
MAGEGEGEAQTKKCQGKSALILFFNFSFKGLGWRGDDVVDKPVEILRPLGRR